VYDVITLSSSASVAVNTSSEKLVRVWFLITKERPQSE